MRLFDPTRHQVRLRRSFLVGLLSVTAAACQPAEPANVILITVDTLRADRLTPYGYSKIETPAIARLADEGIVYERAFADTSWTLPSLSSVMTGKYPSEHRVRSWHDTLDAQENTLAEILKAEDYRTAAIVASYPLDRHFGLDQGFDHYDDKMTHSLFAGAEHVPLRADGSSAGQPREPGKSRKAFSRWQMSRERGNAYRTDAEIADAAIEWLATNRESPVFLWVHFFGPHEKGKRVTLDPEVRKAHTAQQIAQYDPDIEEMDRQVGRLLDTVRADPRFNNTAVVFHSDHGQSLEEHGLFGHGLDLFDTTVHVPMIVRLPGAKRAGTRVAHLVRNLDIFATILELARVNSAATSASRDLLFSRPEADNHAYMESHHPLAFSVRPTQVGDRERKVGRILRGIRTDDTKLVTRQPFLAPAEDRTNPLAQDFVAAQTTSDLYDLARDPRETKNRTAAKTNELQRLRRLLAGYDDGSGSTSAQTDLSDAARERLRSLGYEP